jgi:hypothetical protein
MRFTIVLIAAILLTPNVARSQESGTLVLGAGLDSCGTFIAASTDVKPGSYKQINAPSGRYMSDLIRYQQWFMGFVSALNSAHPDDISKQINVDIAGLDLWMRNWCNQHPVDKVFEGMVAFRKEMQR